MKKIITLILTTLTITSAFSNIKIDTKIAHRMKKIQIKYGGKVGFYTINRNDWSNFAFNDTFYFPVCSIYRFLVVGAILKKSMTDNDLLNKTIKITKNKLVANSSITKNYLNKEMTIKDLCQASIKGDNTATNILIEILGGLKNLRNFTLSLSDHATKTSDLEPKINHVDLSTNENKTTPKIIARDINKLAFSNSVLDKQHRLMFKKWLIDGSNSNNIATQVPNTWTVAEQYNTCQYGTTIDVAIIFPQGSRAIVMAIFYTQAEKNAKPNNDIIKYIAKVILSKMQLNSNTKNA